MSVPLRVQRYQPGLLPPHGPCPGADRTCVSSTCQGSLQQRRAMSSTPLPDSQAQAPSAGQGQHCTWTHNPKVSQETKAETIPNPLQTQITSEASESSGFSLLLRTCPSEREPNIQNKRKKVSFFLVILAEKLPRHSHTNT